MIKLILTQGISSGYFWPIVDSAGDEADLTDWTAKSQVRRSESHTSDLLAELDCLIQDGGVAVVWTATQSLLWDFSSGMFDVILIDPDGVPRQIVAEGIASVNKVVTVSD